MSNGLMTQYYASLTDEPSDYTVLFQTNFPGLGLPTPLFNSLTNLIDRLQIENLACTTGPNFCSLPGNCANYNSISNFSVQLNLTGASDYLNIPIGGFSWTNTSQDICIVALQELPA